MLELVEANLGNSSVKSTHFPECIEILEELSQLPCGLHFLLCVPLHVISHWLFSGHHICFYPVLEVMEVLVLCCGVAYMTYLASRLPSPTPNSGRKQTHQKSLFGKETIANSRTCRQAPELSGSTDSRRLNPLTLQQESYLTELETYFYRIEE